MNKLITFFVFGLFLIFNTTFVHGYYRNTYTRQSENQQKDKLKRPPEINIDADIEKVRALLIKEMLQQHKAVLEKESQSQLTFNVKFSGGAEFLGQVLNSGQKPFQQIIYTLTKIDNSVFLVADLYLVTPKSKGGEERSSINNMRSVRKDIDKFLLEIKTKAEQK